MYKYIYIIIYICIYIAACGYIDIDTCICSLSCSSFVTATCVTLGSKPRLCIDERSVRCTDDAMFLSCLPGVGHLCACMPSHLQAGRVTCKGYFRHSRGCGQERFSSSCFFGRSPFGAGRDHCCLGGRPPLGAALDAT